MKNISPDSKSIHELKARHINRRHFFRILGAAGVMSFASNWEMKAYSSQVKGKIVIIGGGAAGLSMAARLNRWLAQPDITLIDPSEKQYYQPGFTLIASGIYQPDDVWKKQEKCIPSGVKWIKDKVVEVDPVWNQVITARHGKVGYDFLVLTPGIQINWHHIEGFSYNDLGKGNAHSIYDYKGAQHTWTAIQEFSRTGGVGIFTDTYTKHKCGGAPKKICLLTEHYTRKQKTRKNVNLRFYTAGKKLYEVPYYTDRLVSIYRERNIPVNVDIRVKGIDSLTKQVHFERTEVNEHANVVTTFKEDYDFLHFTPPMSAPDFVRNAGLSWSEGELAREGWVMTNQETLVHEKYPNIIALGDCAGIPTSKTSAAIRAQVPVAARNLIALMEGKQPVKKYNGYAACPIITEYGRVLLCEFDYNKEPMPTFPFSMLNMKKEQWSAWMLKTHILKPLYFNGMLKGYA
ncbi:MAG: NAD(P)/FAD-dependent oxidoreductase [Tannerellaceae bacterium]|nr:NAD(P)/FAD-dependent oxidoreductase [Tannerellaceae bacterium]